MLQTLAIAHYRSLHGLVLPLHPLNVITGENGSGKSSLYRALRLLAETAQGGVAAVLAREGAWARRCGPDRKRSTVASVPARSCCRAAHARPQWG